MAGGEHRRSSRRFSCLPLVRIFAASVVATAFAATVVVVLKAGLDPDNNRLSVTRGHMQSAGLLWSQKHLTFEHLRRRSNNIDVMYYAPADVLAVWMSMDAHDRHARNNVTMLCVVAVSVIDMPHAPSLDGMVTISTVHNMVATGKPESPCALWRPRPGSAHRMQLDRWINLTDSKDTLCYISQMYGELNDFTVMLKVEMAILYNPPNGTVKTYYCWPVTIGNTRRIRSEDVTCKPSKAIDYGNYTLDESHLTGYHQQHCNISK